MVEETKKKFSRDYLTWTDEMDKGQNGWKPHVYNAAIKAIHDKCGLHVTKEKICSRMKTFDKHCATISKILSQSGFGWDWVNNKLLMDSDDVWNKYFQNWEAILTIYSKDHATGDGAMTGAESAAQLIELDEVVVEASPELPPKRQRTGDGSFQDAMKSLEPLELPKVTPPLEILAALEKIPDFACSDMLRAYGKLILSECLFQALMDLPMEFRKEWLLMLNEKNNV
ncbi:hypothetical protein VPH35_092438 [Triticum aestivum]